MRKLLMIAAAMGTLLLASNANAANWAGASSMKAAAENYSPFETAGCRSNGRKCPIGSENVCKDGQCKCQPCPY